MKETGPVWRRVQGKILPRSTPAAHLYEYTIKETDYREHFSEIEMELNGPDIEGRVSEEKFLKILSDRPSLQLQNCVKLLTADTLNKAYMNLESR